MSPRRNSPSPYEVMTSPKYADLPADASEAEAAATVGLVASSESVAAPPPPAAKGQRPETESGFAAWWKRTQQPILLRLPKGQAALLGMVFLALIMLSYWVGMMRGYRSGQREPSLQSVVATGQDRAQNPLVVVHDPATAEVKAPSHGFRSSTERAASTPTRSQSDPRELGLNYFVLAHYPKAEAQRLVQFLAGEGVAAAAFGREGKSLYQVVALNGFDKDELDRPGYNQYKQHLLGLGRLWHSRGLGPKLSGIFPALYTGQKVDEMIVSEIQP